MSDNLNSYYRDHWVNVEPERMTRYEAMFQWRDGHEPIIAPAQIGEGQVVADFGCGPGGLALELARRVGETGKVIALDINPDFLEITRTLAERENLSGRVSTRILEGNHLPIDSGTLDRVVCKNVLEYVPDPGGTIREFHRTLAPGGIAHVSDSDWGAVILEPLGEAFGRIMAAANIAFRTPLIGRNLYGLFRAAGFEDVRVQVLATPDTSGALRSVLLNMAMYARVSGKLEDAQIDAFVDAVDLALEEKSYFAVLPQFLVTGRA
jgi:ubiquinone/menaquinone biosynthesis C-methylase UbiE